MRDKQTKQNKKQTYDNINNKDSQQNKNKTGNLFSLEIHLNNSFFSVLFCLFESFSPCWIIKMYSNKANIRNYFDVDWVFVFIEIEMK